MEKFKFEMEHSEVDLEKLKSILKNLIFFGKLGIYLDNSESHLRNLYKEV